MKSKRMIKLTKRKRKGKVKNAQLNLLRYLMKKDSPWHQFQLFFALNIKDPRNFLRYRNQEMMFYSIENQIKHHKFLIHPHSRFRILWETFYSVYMVFNVNYCFLFISVIRFAEFNAKTEFLILLVSDMPVLAEVVLCFITGYYKDSKGLAVMKFTPIMYNYLKKHFIFDIYGLIMGSQLLSFLSLDVKISKNVEFHTIFLLRAVGILARLHKPRYYWKHCISKYYMIDNLISNALSLYLFLPLIIMFLASIFYVGDRIYLSKIKYTEYRTLWNGTNDFIEYASNIWSANFAPKNVEYLTILILNLFSLVYPYIQFFILTSFLLLAFKSKRNSLDEYNNLIDELDVYVQSINISARLKIRLRSYYKEIYKGKYYNENKLLDVVSSEIKEDLLALKIKEIRQEIFILRFLPINELLLICGKLVQEVFFGNDVIAYADTIHDRTYFVAKGSVAVYTNNAEELYHTSSSMPILTSALQIDGIITPVSLNYLACDTSVMYSLSREDCKSIIDQCPEFKLLMEFFHSFVHESSLILKELSKAHEIKKSLRKRKRHHVPKDLIY